MTGGARILQGKYQDNKAMKPLPHPFQFVTHIEKWSYYSTLCGLSCRSQWPRGLRRRSAAARLLRSWVLIPPGAWMFVCCECCVLSGRGLCDELITRPEESYYRLWCVVVRDLETSRMRRPCPALGRSVTVKKKPQCQHPHPEQKFWVRL